MFIISISMHTLLVYRNTIFFFMLIFYPANLFSSCISSRSFLVDLWGFSMWVIMSSRNTFILFTFPILFLQFRLVRCYTFQINLSFFLFFSYFLSFSLFLLPAGDSLDFINQTFNSLLILAVGFSLFKNSVIFIATLAFLGCDIFTNFSAEILKTTVCYLCWLYFLQIQLYHLFILCFWYGCQHN